MSTYRWVTPKYKQGDRVRFRGHERKGNRPLLRGEVRSVETHYTRDGEAYHIYSIKPDYWKLWLHVGDEAIITQERTEIEMKEVP